MSLIDTFSNISPNRLFVSILLGVIAGVSYALLIPVVLESIIPTSEFDMVDPSTQLFNIKVHNYKFALVFLIVCLVIFFARTLSQIILVRLTMDASKDIRVKLYRKILNAPLDRFEVVGGTRVLSSITVDIERIIEGAETFPNLFVSSITLVSMMLLLWYINEKIFLLVLGSILAGGVTFILLSSIGKFFFAKARDEVEGLYQNIESTIFGIKELKLCKSRREQFLNDVLVETESRVLKVSKTGASILSFAVNYGNVIGYFFIGAVTFIFVNYYSLSYIELFGIIMILIYINEPIGVLLETIPTLSLANISIRRINKLFDELPDENLSNSSDRIGEWSSLKAVGVCYQYDNNDNRFSVGPIDLTFKKGTATFIVGGNGSGKSTICKLLSSHYRPSKGNLELDNTVIDSTNIISYRDRVSAVFSDYHLFDRIFNNCLDSKREVIKKYIQRLELSECIAINDGRFSTLNLSTGQRKRLALLISLLEDKDVYIFDEWAADQDPVFKKIFYMEIIEELKRQNKILIIISHDDRYFEVADSVVMIEDGKVLESY